LRFVIDVQNAVGIAGLAFCAGLAWDIGRSIGQRLLKLLH
jgi:hypothetical protein